MKPISAEQLRILVAASEGRLGMTLAGYYEIKGEDPPDRREREKLQQRGMITRPSSGGLIFTERGIEALTSAPVEPATPPTAARLFDPALPPAAVSASAQEGDEGA